MRYLIPCMMLLFFVSCETSPRNIEPTVVDNSKNLQETTGIFNSQTQENSRKRNDEKIESEVNHVIALEVLPTDKYVYVRVKNEIEEFWIAASKQNINVGDAYFYRNGLLKNNFRSKEYDRVFEKIFLVSQLVPVDHASLGNKKTGNVKLSQSNSSTSVKSIKNIIENSSTLAGTEVEFQGTCTKLNPNIMDRNWIHLKDGSADDYDFVVTSSVAVPVGHTVTMKGTVVVDKDFGSGYRYDLIIENAILVRE